MFRNALPSRRRPPRSLPILLTAIAAAAPPARATIRNYNNNAGGNFASPTSWSPTGIPGGSDIANINLTPTSPATLTYDFNYASPLGLLTLNSTSANPLTFLQSTPGDNMNAMTEIIGNTGPATYAQSAATNSFTSGFTLANSTSSTATYSLSGTGTLSSPTSATEYVGNAGTASFVQTGGTHTTGSLIMGNNAGAHAYYSLAGASSLLSTSSETIGSSGTGSLTQAGGTHTSTGNILLGLAAASAGSLTLSAGTLSANLIEAGISGTGSISQSGGSVSMGNGNVILGITAAGQGSYSLTGGSLAAFNLAVGYQGPGTFTQSAGSTSATEVDVGASPGATGFYSLSGTASLAAVGTAVGLNGTGTFLQSGGTHSLASSLDIGYGGNATTSPSLYSLSGGSLSAPIVTIGINSPASLLISGGTMTVSNSISLTDRPGVIFSLTGGTLALSPSTTLDTAGNPARFQWTGQGTILLPAAYTIDSNFSLLGLPTLNGPNVTFTGTLAAPAPSTNNGSITLAGGGIGGSSLFTNNSLITGNGYLLAPLTNLGSILQSDGNLTISANLTNSPTGSITLSPGRLVTLSATLANSGSLNLNSARLTGTGTLTNSAAGTITGPGTIATTAFSNAGTLVLPSPGTLSTPNFTNSGVIQLDSLSATLAGGTLTNTGTLQGHGKVTSPLNNTTGTIEPTSGTLTLAGPSITNATAATIRIAANNELLVTGTFPTNAGSITLTGGTLDTAAHPLTNTGTITAAAGLSTLATPLTNAATGKTIVTGNATATFTQPVTNLTGSEFRVSAGATASFLAPVTGQGQFTGSGSKFFESGASSPSSIDTNGLGSTTVQPTASLSTSYLHESSLTANGPVTLIPNSPASTLGSLIITTGPLDLNNNDLTITSINSTTLRTYLLNHELFSTTADADPNHLLALGYSDSTPTLVHLTTYGDANLDNTINADDYALLDRGYNKHLSTWQQGDFNYDGIVNSQDYLLIDQSLYSQAPGFSPGFLAQRESQFGPAYVSTLLASIPEPTLPLSSILYPLAALVVRRRRA